MGFVRGLVGGLGDAAVIDRRISQTDSFTLDDVVRHMSTHAALYLRDEDRRQLASVTGYEPGERYSGANRGGALETIFPNRLEVNMEWRPV